MKTVLYMHGGSGNHGCEALVRTTAKLAKDSLNTDVILWSKAAQEDVKYGASQVVDKIVVTDDVPRNSFGFYTSYFKYKVLKKSSALHDQFMKNTFTDSIAISIGGDNYCYPWSAKEGVQVDKELRRYCQKNVFWGCSIEEEFMTPEVIEDLKGFDLITVREPLSYQVLKDHGIHAVQVADPAFLLEKKELPLPNGFVEGKTVGINISPLINDYEGGESIAFQNYVKLIEYILNETDMNVCLIPHVVWEQVDDRKPMQQLLELFKNSGRVILLDDHNCEELKGFISRCRFFIGARTHATIAAYSTCVPTLVVGYSIKSRGIALDLFGTHENYVVSVQNMEKDSELTEAFQYIVENETKIKDRLTAIIPEYKERALSAGQALKDLFS